MVIYKTVYESFNPEKHKRQPAPYRMYWRQSVGWVASQSVATKYTQDEHVTRELGIAVKSVANNEILNVLEN